MNTTETRILVAARSVLIREGSGGFSMRKVALEADITLSNVQYYFKSKNELIDGLLNEFLKESKLAVQQCLQIPGAGKKSIYQFVHQVIAEESQADEIKLSLAIISLAETERFDEKLDAFYKELYTQLFDFLRVASNQAKNSKRVKSAVLILLPFINGYGLVSNQFGSNTPAIGQTVTDVIWNILVQPS